MNNNELKEIDELLSSYKEPLVEEQTVEELNENTVETKDIVSNNNWLGNPAYFQTGKKAGQLKPSSGQKSIVSKESFSVSGSLVNGALLIMLVDLAIPTILAAANNKFLKSSGKIKPKQLKLSDETKKEIRPLVDEVVKELALKADAKTLLIVSLIGAYGSNFIAAKLSIEE